MRLPLILTLTAIAASVFAVPFNNISTANQLLHGRTYVKNPKGLYMPETNEHWGVNTNKYTKLEMDKFYQGHVDALHMCSIVMEEAAANMARFDRIFREYFDPADREVFVEVFSTLVEWNGERKGTPKFAKVHIVDDFPNPFDCDQENYCQKGFGAITFPVDPARHREHEEIILCPSFFNSGTLQGGPGREWPGIHTPKCDNIGTRLSFQMARTLGHDLLHEYTHIPGIIQPVLGQATIDQEDQGDGEGYGSYQTRKLDQVKAKLNADSYACFASELTWPKLCERSFEEPFEKDLRDYD